jgi:sensor domain CHASE-containing protein
MPLRWLILVLAAVITTMMAVVLLRAEATALHYNLSRLDRQAQVLRQELREQELELARLRNPARIRAKLAELRLRDGALSGEISAGARREP